MHVIEVFTVSEIVMEPAKHQQLLLESQHPVPTPGRGASTRSHLLPPLGGKVEAPEVFVVVELGLGGAAGENSFVHSLYTCILSHLVNSPPNTQS